MSPPEQATRLVAQFRFSRIDYIAMNKAMTRSSLRTRLIRLGIWLALLFVIIAANSKDVNQFAGALGDLVQFRGVPWQMYALIAAGTLFALFADLLTPLRARRMYRWNNAADKETTIELTDAGIEMMRKGFYSRMDWSLVLRVIPTRDYLFLALSRIQVMVLPRRAFAEGNFEAAIALAHRQVGSHQAPATK